MCMECGFEAPIDELPYDFFYDDFYGRTYREHYCPLCDGGMEIYKTENDIL